jgi:hypothetical protein
VLKGTPCLLLLVFINVLWKEFCGFFLSTYSIPQTNMNATKNSKNYCCSQEDTRLYIVQNN